MKVLVGVDGSSNSLATVAFVGRLLSVERDALIMAYVSPPLPYLGDDQLDPGVAARAQGALSNAVFDEAVSRLPAEWRQRAERVELSGSPSAGLLESADERGVDLMAVGFRGTGLFERFLLGSVSRAVVHSARVPVLVVKTVDEEKSAGPAGVADGSLRVLAAYDGPEVGARIAAVVGQFAWPPGTRGWTVTVVPPMFVHQLPDWLQPITRDADVQAMAEAWQKEYEQQVAQAGEELKRFQLSLPTSFHASEPIVAQGRPAEQILAEIAKEKIDLAVVGSRGRGAVERLLLGSTSSQIVNESPCSVLIAR
jgi:nucleotide-binding universal stress UspA family protein